MTDWVLIFFLDKWCLHLVGSTLCQSSKVPPFVRLMVLPCWQSASLFQFSGFASIAKCLNGSKQILCHAGKATYFINLEVLLC